MRDFHPSQLQAIRSQRVSGITFIILLHAAMIAGFSSGLHGGIKTPTFDVSKIAMITDPPPVVEPRITPPVQINSSQHITIPTVLPDMPPIVETVTDNNSSGLSGGAKDNEIVTRSIVPSESAAIDHKHPLTQPSYPPVSRRLGEQGTVELSLYVLADGHIGDVRVEHSSGFVRLDEAAVQEASNTWKLQPARINGIPVADWYRIVVTFRLKH